MDHTPINPAHYRRFGGVEVNDITQHLSFNLGNVVKYAARAGFKPGVDPIEDLNKAAWYLEKEIERLQAKNRDQRSEVDHEMEDPSLSNRKQWDCDERM